MENVSGTLDLGGFLSEDLSEDVCAALCVRTRGRKLISKTAVQLSNSVGSYDTHSMVINFGSGQKLVFSI